MAKRAKQRIYTRQRGDGAPRYYADFRDYADVGGKREPLVPKGSKRATTDEGMAEFLASERLKELQEKKLRKQVTGTDRIATLKTFAAEHLVEKARSGRVTEEWLATVQKHLQAAVDFLGSDRELNSIGVRDVQKYAHHLSQKKSGRKDSDGNRKTLSPGSVRHYLNALSNLYRRAQGDGCVPPGYNPVASLMDKPVAKRSEARWLEIHEGALILEAARLFEHKRTDLAIPFTYPLIATFLLTGGRQSEVLGLELDDVSFDRKTITFRPNEWRRLKTATSHRSVPMWPQLEEILRKYVFGSEGPKSGLLFPSARPPKKDEDEAPKEAMITDVRKTLDAVAERAGWKEGEIRTKMFRHTYCAARLQTLDRGHPVSVYTVAKEMGHGGDSLVKRVYGHLGTIRHRSDEVEYRVDQHKERLGERLAALYD